MKLDYGTLLSPSPIRLSIGTVRKPMLLAISEVSFEKFGYYEFLLKLDPETFYTKMCNDACRKQWESLSADARKEVCLFDLIEKESFLQKQFEDLFRFFFLETVTYQEGLFILLKESEQDWDGDLSKVAGAITRDNIDSVLGILQEVCCIKDEEEEPPKFKNAAAKSVWEKIHKGKKQAKKPVDKNLNLPNLISAISNQHPSLNYTNIWDLTIFQLLDAFRRMQTNLVFEIDKMRVSVWGDEKKTFNPVLWYKNEFEKTS